MKRQTKYFYIGLLCLINGLLCVTYLPYIIKRLVFLQNYVFVQIEFLLLVTCAIFYLFSPKFYSKQILSFAFGFLYYFLFVKVLVNYL